MCNIWQHPTEPKAEITPATLKKLPKLDFCNITGGEPFLRNDIDEIVSVVKERAKRVVISTNGYFTEKILDVARKNRDIGFRISIEGLPAANDELRGLTNGFDHGMRTLLGLRRMGVKDIGFGITVTDRNARDMLELYHLADAMGLEFATAVVHNSYYFHKYDNAIIDKAEVTACFEELIAELMKTPKIKNWFRAYFNYGLIKYVNDQKRLLPCEAGTTSFFVDPWGEIRPCNGLEDSAWMDSMGNLNESTFDAIWNGTKADEIRRRVGACPKNCWMIGNAAPAMKKHVQVPLIWVVRNKVRSMLGEKPCRD